MKRIRPGIALALIPVLLLALGALRATAVEPGNEHFERTWARTDLPVTNGVEPRTWMWGPEAFTSLLSEPYEQSPGNERTVQYFDKSRMEITNPAGDAASIWYVTNGLLVVEMMTGNLQLGDNSFEPRSPAVVNVAGDADDPNGPTYAGMAALQVAPPLAVGTTITQRVDRAGTVTFDSGLTSYGVTVGHLDSVTNHSIATPFWNFMNSSGTVYTSGQYVVDNLFANEYFATGRPIIEPYWALVRVGGTEREVLIQCFERRCLTYTPGNSPGFVTEAGNVGQHYYAWRYGTGSQTPTATATLTASPTGTSQPSETASSSPSITPSVSPTMTASITETIAPTVTATMEPEGPFAPLQTCGGPLEPNQPQGVAIGPDGSIYIADTGNHQIIKLASNGTRVASWGERGNANNEFLNPRGLTTDGDGNVYVADYNNHRVQVFDSNGNYLRQWGTSGSGNGEFDRPADIAYGSNLIYVTDYGNDRVQVFTTQGQYLRGWGTSGSGQGQFNGPVGIATATDGSIYVVDEGNYRVQYFDSTAAYVGQWGGIGPNDGQFFLPAGIAIDPNFGYAYVTDAGRNEVQVFNALGGHLLTFGASGTGAGEFNNPSAVATNGTNNIWVADRDNMRLQQWAESGPGIVYQGEWLENQAGLFADPQDVVVDQNGFIFIVDRAANRITKYTSDCSFDRVWGGFGGGNNDYYSPVEAAISPDNLFYVVDQFNDRIKVTSNIGTYVREWGQYGTGQGEFDTPSDIAFDANGNAYVVDSGNDRVQVFSNVGVYQFEWGTTGSGAGQFNGPREIMVANNRVYVSDQNQRVQIFDLSGNYLAALTAPTDYTWFTVGDVAADANYVYVLSGNAYYLYDATGAYVGRYTLEDVNGGFVAGTSLTFGPGGDMYVVDDINIGLHIFDVDFSQ